ncbi:MAG: HAS-barrel domain-containing protein, partial [Cyanobacteria bacterium P01_D01_bin.56]
MDSEMPLGSVIQGSLSQGLEVRLHADVSVEDMRVGKFLVVQGVRSRFFCMLTDVSLGTASQRILANPPQPTELFLQEVLAGGGTYGTIDLAPMLMFTPEESEDIGNGAVGNDVGLSQMQLLPVKTIPGHFSQAYDARERDFRSVFGWEDDPHRRNFAIGQPIDMDVPICIDLNRFVERSNGIFGK